MKSAKNGLTKRIPPLKKIEPDTPKTRKSSVSKEANLPTGHLEILKNLEAINQETVLPIDKSDGDEINENTARAEFTGINAEESNSEGASELDLQEEVHNVANDLETLEEIP